MTNNIDRRRREHENPETWKNNRKSFYIPRCNLLAAHLCLNSQYFTLVLEEAHYWEAKEIENHNCYYPNGFNERSEKRYLK